jgi:hypothetical protein
MLTERNIGNTIRLSLHEKDETRVLEGVLLDVDFSERDRVWHRVNIDGVWDYLVDWGALDILARDGKTLPTVEGVYRIVSKTLPDDEMVQLDNEGNWWPFPYVFSGWRTSELLNFERLEFLPDRSVDYPEIKNPEEEAAYLKAMAEKARIWNEGRESARRGEQAFTNPYAICSVCRGRSGDHNQKIHDDRFKE